MNRIARNCLTRITRERGFTLIELLVVIVIIGILIAVAAPSFLGQQDKAKDSTVKQNLAVLGKAAKAGATDNPEGQGKYRTGSTLVSDLVASETQLAGKVSVTNSPASGEYGVCSDSSASELILSGKTESGASFRLEASSEGQRIDKGDCDGFEGEVAAGPSVTGNECHVGETCTFRATGPKTGFSPFPQGGAPAGLQFTGPPSYGADNGEDEWFFQAQYRCLSAGEVVVTFHHSGSGSYPNQAFPIRCIA